MSHPNLQNRFQCSFPGCDASYQHKEHLHRHQAQHRGVSSPCPVPNCERVFSRNDTLRRHIRRDHKDAPSPSSRATHACRACRSAKIRCRGGCPCNTCRAQGHQCTFDNQTLVNPEPTPSETNLQESTIKDRYIQLYFTDFHPLWPILHHGTFSVSHEPPLLVHAVLMIGLWVSGTSSAQRAALDLHRNLGPSILAHRETWETIHPNPFQTSNQNTDDGDPQARDPKPPSTSQWPIATYQAILLYLIFSCISPLAKTRSLDLTLTLPPSDQGILSALVRACLQNNIFYYPTMLARYHDIDSVTCIWVGVEELKRLGLALYKISRLCGRGCDNEADNRLLRLSDLQFPPPDSRRLWNAESNPVLSTLLAEGCQGLKLDGRVEANWISSCGRVLDSNEELEWI
ncbi:hypothetical protein BDW59DRAFT_145389 [Aspergillus cavernicola]|uniref:C2H2 type zinc finger domain protein n=1 Tax=Aspergillus cavernicola TaxID=176166 RepID=A0ABR4IHG6_9EURO